MFKYTLKRILTLIPILFLVSLIVFSLMSVVGDPVNIMAGQYVTDEEIELLREAMGLNRPLLVRYFEYMGNLLRGDLGTTLHGLSVWDEFSARIPHTFKLAIASMIVTIVISLPLGIIAAVKQNTWIDSSLSAIAMAGISLPAFWFGLMLVFIFSITLRWLPATGIKPWTAIILPAICSGINNSSVLTRMTRSSMVDVVRADYLRTARAKGVGERAVILKHALKNALVPIITIIGSQFAFLIGGTVVIESVFAWPGIGLYVVESIRGCEYIAATSVIVIMTAFTGITLLIVDILYAYADPRIKARYTK